MFIYYLIIFLIDLNQHKFCRFVSLGFIWQLHIGNDENKKRISKWMNKKDAKLNEMKIHFFRGPKQLFEKFCNFNVLPLRVFCEQVVPLQRAQDADFTKCLLEKSGISDCNQSNMRKAVNTDQSKMPKAKSPFASLLDTKYLLLFTCGKSNLC